MSTLQYTATPTEFCFTTCYHSNTVLFNTIFVSACDCVCWSLCSFCAFIILSWGNQWPAELTSVCAIDSFQNWQSSSLKGFSYYQRMKNLLLTLNKILYCLHSHDVATPRVCRMPALLAVPPNLCFPFKQCSLFSSWFKFKVATTPSKCSKWRDFFSPRHGAGLLKDAFQDTRTRSFHVIFQKARHYFANSFQ